MKKVAVIGHLDWQGNNMIGAVVKARNIYEELQNQLGKKQVGCVDIYEWRKRKVAVLFGIVNAFMAHKNIVLVCSDTSSMLMKLFKMLKKVFHNKIHYCVVGGDIAELLAQHPEQLEPLRIIDGFYVETIDCVNGLNELGVSGVSLLLNFKCIEPLSADQLVEKWNESYRFCTFSRVIEQKGITDAILAIEKINSEFGRNICELDVYGPIDPTYKEKFEELLKNHEGTKYCGIVDANSSVGVLKDYYCLLFPTKFQTEGIPGTIVDGFAAGLPVICADWVRCRQLVTDGKDGIVYPFGDFDALVSKMKFAIDNPEYVMELKKGCLNSFSVYKPEEAIKPLLNSLSEGRFGQ